MRAKLANPNHCAVPFLSRAGANLCWYYYSLRNIVPQSVKQKSLELHMILLAQQYVLLFYLYLSSFLQQKVNIHTTKFTS